jgi:putative hemolysin
MGIGDSMNQELLSVELNRSFRPKVKVEMRVGRFLVKTITTSEELLQAFALRYQVFQVEVIGSGTGYGLDSDGFDAGADHLAIFDEASGSGGSAMMIATCRLNSSLFTKRFYSEQEFDCQSLLARPETKLEVGRVCVKQEFRRGAIILILWRAIADYLTKTGTELLFGCGSVQTEDPEETLLLYRYLVREGLLRENVDTSPIGKYRFSEFEKLLLSDADGPFTIAEKAAAEAMLPPLCKSYFDIGCYASGSPAIDREFKCIDFLTVLEMKTLDPKVRRKMFGS